MSKGSLEVNDQQLLDRLEPIVRRVLEPDSEEQRTDAVADLQTLLEYALCDLMRLKTSTAGFWCDGVEFQQVVPVVDGRLHCVGAAWCNAEWRVPIFVGLSTNCREVVRVDVGLGDGTLDNLAQHEDRPLRVPSAWLERYRVVAGPPDPRLDPLVILTQLHEWLAANPQGRIVGPDWKYLSLEAAQSLVHDEASSGRPVVVETTWLDGASAVRLARRS